MSTEKNKLKTSQSLDILPTFQFNLNLDGISKNDSSESTVSSFPVKPSNESPRSIILATQRFRAHSSPSKFGSLSNRSRNTSLTVSRTGLNSSQTTTTSVIPSSTKSPENRHRSKTEGSSKLQQPSAEYYIPDSPLGSPLIRTRSNTKEIESNINENLENSDFDISIPYNFKHLKHVDKENKRIIDKEFILEEIPNHKEGWLGKKCGKANKTYWVEVSFGELKLFKSNKKDKLKSSFIIYESNLIFNNDTPLEISLESNQIKGKLTLIGSDINEIAQWKAVLLQDGAISCEISELQRMRQESSVIREKSSKKRQEEEYIKTEKMRRAEGKRSSIQLKAPIDDSDLLPMSWSINSESLDSNYKKKYFYRIKVKIDMFEWNIIRESNDIIKYYKKLMELLPNIKGCIYDNDSISGNINNLKVFNIDVLLRLIVGNRETIMKDKKHRKIFVKFISPLYWQDEKPEGFVLPFNLTL